MPTHQTKVCQEFDDSYNLVTDSQEIEYIMSSYVLPCDWDKYGSLFVKASHGDYTEVWGSGHTVPWVDIMYYWVPLAMSYDS